MNSIKQLIVWCSENGFVNGSRLLGEEPRHAVSTFALFDEIVRLGLLSRDELADLFDQAQEKREKEREKSSVPVPREQLAKGCECGHCIFVLKCEGAQKAAEGKPGVVVLNLANYTARNA